MVGLKFAARDANGGASIRVALVGHICIDANFVDGRALPRTWGSAVLFASQYLAQRDGVCASVVAPHGRDFAAGWPELKVANPPAGDRTLLYENITVNGVTSRKCFHTHTSAPVPIDDALRALVRDAELVAVAPLLPNYDPSYLAQLKALAKPEARFVLLAQGFLRHVSTGGVVERRRFTESNEVLGLFDVVVVSDDDISTEWSAAEAEASGWSRMHPSLNVVVTRNSLGATLFENGAQSTFPVPPIDNAVAAHPVGAGDIFGAALSLSYVESGDIRKAVEAGNDAAQQFLSNK